MTFGSLFSGVGGFDLGLERAGMVCKWQVENEPFCIRVLEHHWPHVARHTDVREFSPNRDEHSVDLICGGFPCQDLSVAGKRAGLGGERSGLFWHVVRVASEIRPEWLVLENVPGLLNSQCGRDMGTVIGALADIGYCVCWRVLDARFFGVAQRRRRVFLICHPDPHRAASVLFESEGGAGNSQASGEAGADVAYRLDGGTGKTSGREGQRTLVAATLNSGGNRGGFRTEPGGHLVAGTLSPGAHPGGCNGRDAERNQLIVHSLRSEGHDASEDGTGRGTPIVAMSEKQSVQQQRPDDGSGDARLRGYTVFGNRPCEYRGARETTIADPLGTEQRTSSNSDAFYVGSPPHPARMREIDGVPGPLDLCPVCLEGPDSPRYRAIGNAVVVNCAEWIGRRIMEVMT